MSGSQGRFPPANAPHPQRRQPTDAELAADAGHAAQAGWSPQPPPYPVHNTQPHVGQPNARPLPPAIPAGRPTGVEQAWSPAPPEPFPPLPPQMSIPPQVQQGGYSHTQPPQLVNRPPESMQPGYGYPPPQGHPQAQSHLQAQAHSEAARAEAWRRQQEQRGPDPAAYDLGSYAMPATAPAQGRPGARDPRLVQQQAMPQAQDMQAQWSPQSADPYAGYAGQPQQQGYAPDYGYQQPVAGMPATQQQQQRYEEEEVEYEEPPRRSRRWLIVGALIGSIGLGGGMAYGYKYLFSPKAGDKSQVVRAPREPAKVAPTDRGGKQFAATDSKLMNRLPSEGAANASGGAVASETDSSGVRRVQTVPVGRDMAPLPTSGAGPSAAMVPGMTIVSGTNFPSPGGPPGSEFETAGRGGPGMQSPQQSPQRIAVATPPQAPAAPPRQPVARAPGAADPDAAAAPPRAAPTRQQQAAVPPTGAPSPVRPKPAGYVAVLGFQKSQMEAMKMMADLQQKYESLRERKLEIVQSDGPVGNLGVIYRVIVGPRGNVATARQVCSELLQAGMPQNRCYPMGQ